MSLKPYPNYENCGGSWLQEMPQGWERRNLQDCAEATKHSFVDGPFGSDLKNEEYSTSGVPLIQLNNISEGRHNLASLKYVPVSKAESLSRHNAKPGDIVIAKMAEPVARAAIVSSDYDSYVIVADCVRLRVDEVLWNRDFIQYWINSSIVRGVAESLSGGITRLRINLGAIRKLPLLRPSLSEQTAIAQFLNLETAKVDDLIAEQEKLIALLAEKRQATISHAVTKGLDPSVEMKDSGVEWLGQVPAHWRFTQAKRFAAVFVPQRNKPELNDTGDGIYWVTMEDMKLPRIGQANFCVSQDAMLASGSRTLKSGSVIASCVGSFDVASINDVEIIINQQLQAYIPDDELQSEFLRYAIVISGDYFRSVGTSATLAYVNQQGFGNLPIPLPSLTEQQKIVAYLDHELGALASVKEQALRVIELLKERRTALISAAVTGKIDVRDAVKAEEAA